METYNGRIHLPAKRVQTKARLTSNTFSNFCISSFIIQQDNEFILDSSRPIDVYTAFL